MVFFKMSQQKHKESGKRWEKSKTSKTEGERHSIESPFDVNRFIPVESNTNYETAWDGPPAACVLSGSKQTIFTAFEIILPTKFVSYLQSFHLSYIVTFYFYPNEFETIMVIR